MSGFNKVKQHRCGASLHVQGALEDVLQFSIFNQQGLAGNSTDPAAAAAVAEVLVMRFVKWPPAIPENLELEHVLTQSSWLFGLASFREFARGIAEPRSHCGCRSGPGDF